ncbi:MAG: hypothetical protein ACE5FY_00365, partial [Nitrospiria bacterium]
MKKSYIIFSTLLMMLMPLRNASADHEIPNIPDLRIPRWVKSFRFKGDFRLRYQHDKKNGENDRNRGRVRARLGINAKVTEDLKVHLVLPAAGTTREPPTRPLKTVLIHPIFISITSLQNIKSQKIQL